MSTCKILLKAKESSTRLGLNNFLIEIKCFFMNKKNKLKPNQRTSHQEIYDKPVCEKSGKKEIQIKFPRKVRINLNPYFVNNRSCCKLFVVSCCNLHHTKKKQCTINSDFITNTLGIQLFFLPLNRQI